MCPSLATACRPSTWPGAGGTQLLVLDIEMPGLSGLEVTRRVRECPATATIPIVLLTGRETHDDILAGWHSGADHYLTKPLAMPQLRYFIESLRGAPEPGVPWEDLAS